MRSTSRLQAHWWHVAGLVFSVAFALVQTPVTTAQSTPPGELAGIRAAAERFLRALDDLDWAAFRVSWASEPTVFFPFADTPDRVNGQVAVETRWRRFFDEARARRAGPPYLHLKPRDLRAERYGDVGLVTFMLDGYRPLAGSSCRRSGAHSFSSGRLRRGSWPICMRPQQLSRDGEVARSTALTTCEVQLSDYGDGR